MPHISGFLVFISTLKGFVKLKKIQEKLGSGWVGQAPTWICIFFFFFFVLFLSFYMFPKKMDKGMGGWYLTNPSFSRIFGIFST